MNNNDFYSNLDRIRKLYLKQNYDEAVRIADKIDFKRLKEWKYIAMLINLYEAVGRLEDVRYFCILAYNRNLGGKKLLYKLTKVYIRLEDIDEAEEVYDEYLDVAGRDSKRYELLYELKVVQGAKKTELIKILEDYMKRDLDEKYSYTLAELYAKTKQNEKCINLCDRIIERFEEGEAVEKAEALKNSLMNPQPAVSAAENKVSQILSASNEENNRQVLNINSAPATQDTIQFIEATAPIPSIPSVPVEKPVEKPVGQNTLGFNVEQIMAEAAADNQDITMAPTQMIPDINSDIYATQEFPEPQENFYGLQEDADGQLDMFATNTIPQLPDEEEEQEITAIEEQPVVPLEEEDLIALNKNKEEETEEPADETAEEPQENEEPQEQAEEAEAAGSEGILESEIPLPPEGSTIRVDVDAINSAIKEAAATKEDNLFPQEETQDIDSTMAMVEAALADETEAAQLDARMDMPEYADEYAAPVKEKITLRPFQPEIDKVYEIPMEVKRYFTKYTCVQGLEAQIGEYFESVKYEDKMGTSAIGNIIISGNRSSDKTTLAINIVKALNTLNADNARKIARTTGDNINQRGIERSVGKLLGAALIIEEAGVLDRQRILELLEVMESDTQEMLIILEDSESEIKELLKNNPELIDKFNHRITYKQFTVNELVEMCKRYAEKCQYTIDEKALLQLYLRIDDIHSNGDGVSLEDVRDVIDCAIEDAEKRASKKFFGGVKKKKIGEKEYTILVESDFK